jgi:sulfur carrier protein
MVAVVTGARASIEILINGEFKNTGASTLAELVEEQGLAGVRVATALNGDFVPERERRNTLLGPRDRIEILTPRQGG